MTDRRLLSTRRLVPQDRRTEYERDWSRVVELAKEHGFHAWRFRAVSPEELYVEFLEFRRGADPRKRVQVAWALEEIRHHFPDPAPPPSSPDEEWDSVS
jgi:hypothetical protein